MESSRCRNASVLQEKGNCKSEELGAHCENTSRIANRMMVEIQEAWKEKNENNKLISFSSSFHTINGNFQLSFL